MAFQEKIGSLLSQHTNVWFNRPRAELIRATIERQEAVPAPCAALATWTPKEMTKHEVDVYLVNTGWSGGAFGTGKRMDISLTREMVHAALSGALRQVEYDPDPIFHVLVPRRCPGIEESSLLTPVNTWQDKSAYAQRANKLAGEFANHFQKAYGNKGIEKSVADACPTAAGN